MSAKELNEENERLKKENEKLKKKLNEERKYMPTLSELLDRLAINQIKEVKIPEHRDKYSQEIKEILHDIDLVIKENNIVFNAQMLRALIVIMFANREIWLNEENCRKGIAEGNSLPLSHSLNGVRNRAKNIIQSCLGGRQDYKVDCLASSIDESFKNYEPSW